MASKSELNDMQESQKAKMRALRILTRTDKSESDLKASLFRAGFSSDAVEEAIEYVKAYGYIDDERYARKYVEYHKSHKGRLRIQYELTQKGIRKDMIERALDHCEDFHERTIIREIINKKWIQKNPKDQKPDQKELNRLYAYLVRQGFSNGDIWTVLREENLT